MEAYIKTRKSVSELVRACLYISMMTVFLNTCPS